MNQSLQLENLKENGIVVFRVLKTFIQFNFKHILYYFEDFNTTFLKNSSIIDTKNEHTTNENTTNENTTNEDKSNEDTKNEDTINEY